MKPLRTHTPAKNRNGAKVAALATAALLAVSAAGCAEVVQALDEANQRIMAHNARLRAEIDAMNAGRSGQRGGAAVVGRGRLYDELAKAFEEREPEKVRRLLASGVNVNATMTYEYGAGDYLEERTEPVLIAAAKFGYDDIMKIILAQKPDISVRGQDGDNVLTAYLSSEFGDKTAEMVRILIQKGADVNASNARVWSVLEMAESNNEIAAVLRAAGAKKNPMEKADARAADAYGNTALMFALKAGNLQEVKRLIAAGADVNAVNRGGNMPLLLAIEGNGENKGNKYPPIEVLLAAGANASAADREGETALIKATPDTKLMKMLLDKGADVNAARTSVNDVTDNKKGYTALMQGAVSCDAKAVKMLIAAGADLSAKDEDGRTAWDYASQGAETAWWGMSGGCSEHKDAKTVLNMLKPSGKKAAAKKKR